MSSDSKVNTAHHSYQLLQKLSQEDLAFRSQKIKNLRQKLEQEGKQWINLKDLYNSKQKTRLDEEEREKIQSKLKFAQRVNVVISGSKLSHPEENDKSMKSIFQKQLISYTLSKSQLQENRLQGQTAKSVNSISQKNYQTPNLTENKPTSNITNPFNLFNNNGITIQNVSAPGGLFSKDFQEKYREQKQINNAFIQKVSSKEILPHPLIQHSFINQNEGGRSVIFNNSNQNLFGLAVETKIGIQQKVQEAINNNFEQPSQSLFAGLTANQIQNISTHTQVEGKDKSSLFQNKPQNLAEEFTNSIKQTAENIFVSNSQNNLLNKQQPTIQQNILASKTESGNYKNQESFIENIFDKPEEIVETKLVLKQSVQTQNYVNKSLPSLDSNKDQQISESLKNEQNNRTQTKQSSDTNLLVSNNQQALPRSIEGLIGSQEYSQNFFKSDTQFSQTNIFGQAKSPNLFMKNQKVNQNIFSTSSTPFSVNIFSQSQGLFNNLQSQTGLFGNSQSGLFSTLQNSGANLFKKESEDEDDGEGSQDLENEQKDISDPTKTTSTYAYEDTGLLTLFKQTAKKIKIVNGPEFQNAIITIQKSKDKTEIFLYIKSNFQLRYSGRFIKNITKSSPFKAESLIIEKIMDSNKTELKLQNFQTVKILFEKTEKRDRLIQICNQYTKS